MKIPEIIENRADFCALSTLIGAILGAMALLAGIVIHFLPGIAGMILYGLTAIAVVFKVLLPLMRLHDKMKHNTFPIGYIGGFVLTFMGSLYLIEITGLTP